LVTLRTRISKGREEKDMRLDTVFGVLVALTLGTLPLQAEVIPGKWQKVEAQPVGTALNVELNSGERLIGKLVQVQPDALLVETLDGERRMDAAEVKKISLSGVKDSSMDGALAGAGLGALGGIGLGVLVYSATDNSDDNLTGALVGGVAIGAGIGFGAGLALDAASHGEVTIYRAK
jgi:hypothetical protein